MRGEAGFDRTAAASALDAMTNDIARQLRAQIPASTDPKRLERMALEAERRPKPSEPAAMPQGSDEARGADHASGM